MTEFYLKGQYDMAAELKDRLLRLSKTNILLVFSCFCLPSAYILLILFTKNGDMFNLTSYIVVFMAVLVFFILSYLAFKLLVSKRSVMYEGLVTVYLSDEQVAIQCQLDGITIETSSGWDTVEKIILKSIKLQFLLKNGSVIQVQSNFFESTKQKEEVYNFVAQKAAEAAIPVGK